MSVDSEVAAIPSRRPVTRPRKGAMIVFVAVVLVILLGFLAVTLDAGQGNRQRRLAQTAADAGALAGAVELWRLEGVAGRHDSAVAAATREVLRNGFLAEDIVSPCPCNPPVSGPHAGDVNYIEVPLTKSMSTVFGSVLGVNSFTYGARGVGGAVPFAQDCLVALDPNGPGAIEVINGGSLSTTYTVDGQKYSCSIAVN
ncbi:MAG TPA: pilus assembly protein TadG-related protein, partial [Gemmatimonadaceae bacterium]